jgi:hypothetical protein
VRAIIRLSDVARNCTLFLACRKCNCLTKRISAFGEPSCVWLKPIVRGLGDADRFATCFAFHKTKRNRTGTSVGVSLVPFQGRMRAVNSVSFHWCSVEFPKSPHDVGKDDARLFLPWVLKSTVLWWLKTRTAQPLWPERKGGNGASAVSATPILSVRVGSPEFFRSEGCLAFLLLTRSCEARGEIGGRPRA